MDDLSSVEQPPIGIQYTSADGPFRTVSGFQVPDPPKGCESAQMLDWGSVMAIMAIPLDQGRRARVIEAYALRWNIATKEVDGIT